MGYLLFPIIISMKKCIKINLFNIQNVPLIKPKSCYVQMRIKTTSLLRSLQSFMVQKGISSSQFQFAFHQISLKYHILVQAQKTITKYEYYHSCLRTLLVTMNNCYKQKYYLVGSNQLWWDWGSSPVIEEFQSHHDVVGINDFDYFRKISNKIRIQNGPLVLHRPYGF